MSRVLTEEQFKSVCDLILEVPGKLCPVGGTPAFRVLKFLDTIPNVTMQINPPVTRPVDIAEQQRKTRAPIATPVPDAPDDQQPQQPITEGTLSKEAISNGVV